MPMPTTDVSHEDGDRMDLDDATPEDVRDSNEWPNRRLLGAFLDDKARKRENTYTSYRTRMRRLHAWLEEHDFHVLELSEVKFEQFLNDVAGADYSENTVSLTYDGVRHLFLTLDERYGVIDLDDGSTSDPTTLSKDAVISNPEPLSKQKQNARRLYVDKAEKEQLLEHAPDPIVRSKLTIQLLWETGFRRGTMANITIDENSLDRENRVITAYSPKADDDVRAAYSEAVEDTLAIYLDLGVRDGFRAAATTNELLVDYNGPLDGQGINVTVKQAAENAGLQEVIGHDARDNPRYAITAHTLRHSHAMDLLDRGFSLPEVKQSLGHKDIEVTQVYTDMLEDEHLERMKERGPASRTTSL